VICTRALKAPRLALVSGGPEWQKLVVEPSLQLPTGKLGCSELMVRVTCALGTWVDPANSCTSACGAGRFGARAWTARAASALRQQVAQAVAYTRRHTVL
jgi:hypothetical protein